MLVFGDGEAIDRCWPEDRGATAADRTRYGCGSRVAASARNHARTTPGGTRRSCRFVAAVIAHAVGLAVLAPDAQANDPVARDVAAEVGLNFHVVRLGKTQGELPVFDYDGDGDLDILLSTHGGSPWALMQNQGDDTFVEVLLGTFYKTDRHGCVDADFGSISATGRPDGLPDLYCVTGACQGKCKIPYPKALFIQRPDHTFVDVATSWGVADPHGRGRKPIAFDFDNDGLTDIVVANEGPSIFPSPNRLYRNRGRRLRRGHRPAVSTQQDSICVISGISTLIHGGICCFAAMKTRLPAY